MQHCSFPLLPCFLNIAVRAKARDLVELLQDTKMIREERRKARHLMQRILGGSVGSHHRERSRTAILQSLQLLAR